MPDKTKVFPIEEMKSKDQVKEKICFYTQRPVAFQKSKVEPEKSSPGSITSILRVYDNGRLNESVLERGSFLYLTLFQFRPQVLEIWPQYSFSCASGETVLGSIISARRWNVACRCGQRADSEK